MAPGSLPPEIFSRVLNQAIRNRGAGGNAHARDAGEPFRIDLTVIVDQISSRPLALGDLAELVGVLAIARSDDQHQIDFFRELLHRILAVLRRVADIFFRRRDHLRKSLLQRVDHCAGVVDTQGGLGQNRDLARIGDIDHPRFRYVRHDAYPIWSFTAGADDLVMSLVADENDPIALSGKFTHLTMDFFYQRAGRVDDDFQLLFFCPLPLHGGHSVSAEYQLGLGGHLVDRLDEAHAARGEVANDVQVVDDLVEHIKGRPRPLEGGLPGFDRHLYAGTKAAGLCNDDFLNRHRTASSLEESRDAVNGPGRQAVNEGFSPTEFVVHSHTDRTLLFALSASRAKGGDPF